MTKLFADKRTFTMTLMCVGLAFIKAGFFAYAFTEGIFPYLSSKELMISGPTIVSYVSMSVVLLVAPLFSKYYGELKNHPSVAVITTVLVTFGSLIGTFSENPFFLDAFSVTSAICVGGASSLMYIIWGEMMSEFSYDNIKMQISITLIITFVLYLAALLAPAFLSTFLVIVFPLISGVIMLYLMRSDYDPNTGEIEIPQIKNVVQISASWKKWLILLGIPHLVLSTANTALWAFSNIIQGEGSSIFLLLSFGFGALFAVFLLLIALDRESQVQISALTRYAIPLMTLAPILIFLGRSDWIAVIGFMLVCVTIVFADFLNWILFCELAHENPKHRSKIIGWGRLFIHLGMLIGCIIGRVLVESVQYLDSETVWVSMLCLVVVVMTVLTLYVNSVEEYRVNTILRKMSKQNPYKAKLDESYQPYFRENHDLTPREFEILVFLHEGFSVSQIQAQLFVSQNTVNTHTKRIYKKLDVHSKVELYNRIEQIIQVADLKK